MFHRKYEGKLPFYRTPVISGSMTTWTWMTTHKSCGDVCKYEVGKLLVSNGTERSLCIQDNKNCAGSLWNFNGWYCRCIHIYIYVEIYYMYYVILLCLQGLHDPYHLLPDEEQKHTRWRRILRRKAGRYYSLELCVFLHVLSIYTYGIHMIFWRITHTSLRWYWGCFNPWSTSKCSTKNTHAQAPQKGTFDDFSSEKIGLVLWWIKISVILPELCFHTFGFYKYPSRLGTLHWFLPPIAVIVKALSGLFE